MSYASLGNEEFYPTPKKLIDKMLSGIDLHEVKDILEPEAGKGDIVDAIIEKCNNDYRRYDKLNIDTIEIDNNLAHILKGKGYRVVHNDFLTFNTQKRYDLIIMNPPFSNGDRHLLKALDLQQNGGAIICILNAETLKNPYTNTRKDLVRKLTELNADIEYLEHTFSNAEHSTDVEIALIKVFIPKKETDSYIFEKLKKGKDIEENDEIEHQELIEDDYIKEIIDRYNLEINAGIELINEHNAMKPFILKEFDSDYEKDAPMLKLCLNNYDNKKEVTINDYIKAIRGKYWKALFRNPKFVGKLTGNLQDKYYNKVSELVDYDFSLYNIYTIKLEMQQNVIKGVEDTILELFEEFSNKYHWLDETSKNIHYYNGWKTNKSWKINEKVIIPLRGFRDNWCYGRYPGEERYIMDYDYQVIRKLSDIEKVFNYLDGNITENISLENALTIAQNNYQSKDIVTKFFKITFYKKGTCHLTFRNLDLLHKFNIYGSQKKNWLPPSYGKAKYDDMSKEEQEVINEFEGKESYEKTLTNTKYYITNSNTLLELPA